MLRGRLGSRKNKSYEDIPYSCTIRFLDDTDPISVTYKKETKGQWLIDHVCRELNLAEKDYFGLRFVDAEKQRHWLDPWKPVHKQLKNVNPVVLCFRVKFYPTDPMKLKEEITRYFLFLQLRRDLHHGRLLCSPADANKLAAYIIQSEVGDYDPEDHKGDYVSNFKMLPKQTAKQEEKIAELHRELAKKSMVPNEAEAEFLRQAAKLDTYGVDPHPVKQEKLGYGRILYNMDQKGNQMYLGVTHLGIVTFQGNKRTHLFKWPQITKIAFEGKMFIVHVTISEGEENSLLVKRKKHACGFKCPTYSACKHLWKCAVEQQYFFTLASATEAPKVTSGGGLFTRGSKFRFSGRCQKEVYSESQRLTRDEPHFARSISNPTLRSSTLRSASLPSKLKDKNIINAAENEGSVIVVEPGNQLSGAVSLDFDRPNGTVIQEEIEESFPDQTPVKQGDLPYDPIQSPSSENLPPFPTIENGNGGEPHLEQPDYDAQIQQLQMELVKSKSEADAIGGQGEGEHQEERPVDTLADALHPRDPPPAYEENETQQSNSPLMSSAPTTVIPTEQTNNSSISSNHGGGGGANNLTSPADPVISPATTTTLTPPPPGLTCCKALTYTFFFLFFVMAAIALCVLESELDVPVLKDLRQMPEVQDFKATHYNPFKTTVMHKMGGWYKA